MTETLSRTRASVVAVRPTHSLFEEPWWLDAVAEGGWGEALVESGGCIIGRLPYTMKRRFGMRVVGQPPLTPGLGPWVDAGSGSYSRRIGVEKKILSQLIEQIPACDVFSQNFSPTAPNVLPFHWAGFSATINYTYRLEDLTDLEAIWAGFSEDVRRHARRAERDFVIDVDPPLETLLELNRATFDRQRRSAPCTDDQLRRLDAACSERGARRIFAARDADGEVRAILYLVWDDRAAYALINARNAALQSSDANALVFWEAIKFAAGVTKVFDLDGSMVEPIEHFLRGFGGRQTPYLHVGRSNWRARPLLSVRDARERQRQKR